MARGDYISREAIMDALLHEQYGYLCEDAIKAIPAADVVEVRKAKWVWLSSTYDRTPCEKRYECSNCHHETITHNSDPWEKFCPNCGASMDKEVDKT